MKRVLIRIACVSSLVLLTCVCVVRCCGSKMIYPGGPPYTDASYEELSSPWKKQAVSFKRDGVELQGWLIESGRNPLVIFYGGNAMDAVDILPFFSENIHHDVLLVNYGGYGKSTGSPSEKPMVEDAVYILDEVVRQTHRQYGDVVLLGQSLGSGVAIQVAAQRPVGKLILMVPFDSMSAVADGILPVIPLSWFMADSWKSVQYVPSVKAPVTIMSGGEDRVIPVKHARRLNEAFRQSRADYPDSVRYLEFPAAGHNDLWNQRGFWRLLNREIEDRTPAK